MMVAYIELSFKQKEQNLIFYFLLNLNYSYYAKFKIHSTEQFQFYMTLY